MVISDEERKEKAKAYGKAYREKPENKAKEKARNQTSEYKEKRKLRELTPKVKAQKKAYRETHSVTPESKAKKRAYQRTPEYRAKVRAKYQTPEYIAKKKLYNAKPENIEREIARRKTHEYIAKMNVRRQTSEYKAMTRKSDNRPERIAKKKAISFKLKMEVFSHYSKTISNSDVPCCACCLYNDIRGLSVDHIMPISKQSASEKLLPKTGDGLWKYLKNKGYPEGYQILCHICNKMKLTKLECPHQLDKVRTYCEIKEIKN